MVQKNDYEIGIAFIENKDYERAIDFLSKFIAENPNNSEAYENRAIAYYFIHEDKKALNDLDKAIEFDPKNENAIYNRGLRYRDSKNYDKALENFLLGYNLHNKNVSILENIVHIYYKQKKYDLANKFCVELLATNPDKEWGIRTYAGILQNTKEYEGAIFQLEKILRYKPDDINLLNSIGYNYMKIGKLEESELFYKTAIQYDNQFAYPLNNWGYLEFLRKNYDKALELINNSIKIDPSNSYAFKNRAIVYLALGNKESAYQDLIHAKDLGYEEYWGEEVSDLLKKYFT